MIQWLADESRVHPGEELLNRTIRHATDRTTEKIVEAVGETFQFKYKIGMKSYMK